MKIAQEVTAIEAFDARTAAGMPKVQRAKIVAFIAEQGGDWSIGEIADAMNMERSTVSARINELIYEYGRLEARPSRKDKRSGITVRPVAIPATSKRHPELF